MKENTQQNPLITCYGKFWKRAESFDEDYGSYPRGLWASRDYELVDFSSQAGVYILYEGTDISNLSAVYIGKSTCLGRRIKEHTRNHLWNRWSFFSWFGILPITKIKKERCWIYKELLVFHNSEEEALKKIEKKALYIDGYTIKSRNRKQTLNPDQTIKVIEALLITLFEPRLNNSRGSWGGVRSPTSVYSTRF